MSGTWNKHKTVILLSLYLITTIFVISLIRYPGLANERAGVITVTDFEGHTPFQYRILMPCLIRTIEFITPEFVKDKVDDIIGGFVNAKLRNSRSDLPDYKADKICRYGYRTFVFFILNGMAFLMFLITLRFLALALNIFSERTCDLLPLGMALVIPVFYDYGNFMYDFTHLFLFTFALLLLYQKRWKYYLIIFVLALLNKETAVMLLIVYALNYYSDLPRKKYIRLLGLQILIFLIIKTALYFLFLDNPSGLVEWHLMSNLEYISKLSNYFRFEPIGKGIFFPIALDIPLPRGLNLPMFFLIFISVAYRWKEKPLFLRRSIVYIIILFLSGFAMGMINELRSYYCALPVIYILGMAGIVKFIETYINKTAKAEN